MRKRSLETTKVSTAKPDQDELYSDSGLGRLDGMSCVRCQRSGESSKKVTI